MNPQELVRLQGLGGEVVEITLNNGRRAIGFVSDADSDKVILCPLDNPRVYQGVTYRTPQVKHFDHLDPGEIISLEHNPPRPGTRILLRFDNSVHVCGYTMPTKDTGAIALARELFGGKRNKRSHKHLRERIASARILKRTSDAS